MTIKELFHKAIISGADPLSITELGFAYLNDVGTWNININSQNTGCINKTITVGQLLDIFQNHCTCYKNQTDCFEEKREEMIHILQQHDPNTIINL
ncbi:hypothetical protein WKT02_01495 [Erysipelotrichaceae bacterium HCN-30851]